MEFAPPDLGGKASTTDFTQGIIRRLGYGGILPTRAGVLKIPRRIAIDLPRGNAELRRIK